MTKNILTLAALLVASAAFVACSNEDNIIEEQQPVNDGQQVYTLTINASKGDDVTTRALEDINHTLTATWKAGEEVTVTNVTQEKELGGTLVAQSDGASTTLSGQLTGAIAEGDQLLLKFLSPDYSAHDGTLTGTDKSIDKTCDYAEATVEVASVTTVGSDKKVITIKGTTAFFSNKQAIAKFTLMDKVTGEGLNASHLQVVVKASDGLALNSLPEAAVSAMQNLPTYEFDVPANTYTVNEGTGIIYVAIPLPSLLETYPNLQVYLTFVLTATVPGTGNTTRKYTYTRNGFPFKKNQYYEIGVKLAPVGAIRSGFSVSSNKKVYFSQGNLIFTRESTDDAWGSGVWSFMAHQYETVEEPAYPYCSANYADRTAIGLFGWGTSGYNHRTDFYQPWSTGGSSTDYFAYGVEGNNLYDGTGKADWGYNAISNGGNTENSGWRTLTSAEWNYLFNDRTASTVNGTANARFVRANLSIESTTIHGVILFPDDYNHPEGVDYPTDINGKEQIQQDQNAWSVFTEYDNEAWTKMEAAGAVFLPCTGFRQNSDVNNGVTGFYWTSSSGSVVSNNPMGDYSAARVSISTGDVVPISVSYKDRGHAVRLVMDVNATN